MYRIYKNLKIVKVILAICIILSSFVNAAIVSENDGSAFVSKAEFEIFKNNLSMQIGDYEKNVANKVDDTIANYIVGVEFTKTFTENVINSEWDDVTECHYSIAPEYTLPDATFQMLLGTYYLSAECGVISDFPEYMEAKNAKYTSQGLHFQKGTVEKKWNQNITGSGGVSQRIPNTNRRPLVLCTGQEDPSKTESGITGHGDYIWNGIALRYNESYQILRDIITNKHWSYMDQVQLYSFEAKCIDYGKINFGGTTSGSYISNFGSGDHNWWPFSYKFQYTQKSTEAASGWKSLTWDTADEVNSFNASVTLDKYGDKTKEFEHIIQYDKTDTWTVSNENFTKTFMKNSGNTTANTNNLFDAMTITNKGGYCGTALHVYPAQHGAGNLPITNEKSSSNILPSVGMIGSKRADQIYQDNNTTAIYFEDVSFAKERPKLHEGFQLLAATKGTQITWKPKFSEVKVHKSATAYDTNAELKLYFSTEKFTDKSTTSSESSFIKFDDGTGNMVNYYKTSGQQGTVNFTMPKDSIIYVKWEPVTTDTYLKNYDWLATLNLKACNTFDYIKAEKN